MLTKNAVLVPNLDRFLQRCSGMFSGRLQAAFTYTEIKSRYDAKFVATGGTGGCRYDQR